MTDRLAVESFWTAAGTLTYALVFRHVGRIAAVVALPWRWWVRQTNEQILSLHESELDHLGDRDVDYYESLRLHRVERLIR